MAETTGRLCRAREFLLELETDKVNVELTAEQSGVLQEVLKDSGDTVQVGEIIGTISEGEGEGGKSTAPQADAQESAGASEEKVASSEKTAEPREGASDEADTAKTRTIASPAARKLAREKASIYRKSLPVIRSEGSENRMLNLIKRTSSRQKLSLNQNAQHRRRPLNKPKMLVNR